MELKEGVEARKLKMASLMEQLAELSTKYIDHPYFCLGIIDILYECLAIHTHLQTSYHPLQLLYDASQALLSEMCHALRLINGVCTLPLPRREMILM